jgi:hypothetical protein
MPNYICKTCGTQFAERDTPPTHCPICNDERQYVGWGGQQWTTLAELRAERHNLIKTEEQRLTSIGSLPEFAIAQRALLVQTSHGNVLWDCISLIDDETVAAVNALGGITAIAISHPHFHACMVEWSRAFNHAPIYIHSHTRDWVMRPDASIVYWQGEHLQLNPEITLILCGGHFAGSQVLHWAGGAEGKGVLLCGDTIYVVQDRNFVSFMYSYPNLVPLPAKHVQNIVNAVSEVTFDRLYSAWSGRVVMTNAHHAVIRSAERYIRAITTGL